jgi:xanthine dehydrogenase YagS FAD-binding subunit
MKPFAYERATDPASAVAAVTGHAGAMFLGGGTNLVDHLKLEVARPDLLVDISRLPLADIAQRPDGTVRIGTNVRNSDLAANPLVRAGYQALSEAVLAGASGQLRNMATTGGNLGQRTRCVYFNDVSTPCNKREPGTGCPAIGGYTRYHAILGASEHCVATHPSDMAVALAALDASVIILGSDGERAVPACDFHRLPGNEPARDNVLQHGELVIAVDLPRASPMTANSVYRKVRDRASYAFALVSVAAAMQVNDGIITDVAIALGGVAHKPWRARSAETHLRGAAATEDAFRAAAERELASAQPLPGNEFKVTLATRTIVAVLRKLAANPAAPGTEAGTSS